MQSAQGDRPVLSIMAILGLVATGIIRQPEPLRSARPVQNEAPEVVMWGDERVPARLWQDPLKTAGSAARQDLKQLIQHVDALGKDTAAVQRLADEAREFLTPPHEEFGDRPLDNILVIPVLVPPVGYAEDAESRLRIRNAVVSGLSEANFVPLQAKRIGYFWHQVRMHSHHGDDSGAGENTPDAAAAVSSVQQRDALLSIPRTHMVVPFEWFKEKGRGSVGRRAVVLWIDEEKLETLLWHTLAIVRDFCEARRLATHQEAHADNEHQVSAVEATAEKSDGEPDQHPPADRDDSRPTITIVGPTSSTGLIRLARQRDDPARVAVRDWATKASILSPFATLRREKLQAATSQRYGRPGVPTPARIVGVPLFRIPVTDDTLMRAILEEFVARGIDLNVRNRFVIISEWDTHYGRDIREAFATELETLVTASEGERQEVTWFSYLRGLDGISSSDSTSGSSSERTTTDEPDGPSQLDSLRRLVGRILAKERTDRVEGAAKGEVVGIGILGSDEYDKLLILQALRAHFPGVLFFTTDLDARYSHPTQTKWTRNLVVASSFDLHLGSWQNNTPPFRNSYMPAVFLACRHACRRPTEEVIVRGSLPAPSVYEIGTYGPTRLTSRESDAHYGKSGSDRQLWIRQNVHEISSAVLWVGVLLLALFLVALVFQKHRMLRWIPYLDTWLHQSVDASMDDDAPDANPPWVLRSSKYLQALGFAACMALIGALGLIACASDEPIALFQGTSVWPTQLIRLIAMFLCFNYLIVAMARVYVTQKRAQHDFGQVLGIDSTAWATHQRRITIPSRLRRTLAYALLYMAVIVCVDTLFGLPAAPLRGEIAATVDGVLAYGSRTMAILLLFFVFDATVLRTQLIRKLIGRTVHFGTEQAKENRAFHESREIRYAATLSQVESRILLYPFVILLILACSRHRLFDAWYWNAPLLFVIGGAFGIVIWSGLALRSSAERLRRSSLRVIDSEIEKAGTGGLLERLRGYRKNVEDMRLGAFASLAGNPVVQGVMIPLGGLGGVALLENIVK